MKTIAITEIENHVAELRLEAEHSFENDDYARADALNDAANWLQDRIRAAVAQENK